MYLSHGEANLSKPSLLKTENIECFDLSFQWLWPPDKEANRAVKIRHHGKQKDHRDNKKLPIRHSKPSRSEILGSTWLSKLL